MARKTNLPRTPEGIRAWLKGAKQGKALLASLTKEAIEEAVEAKCRACEHIRPYPKALIVLRKLEGQPGDEVYVEEGVKEALTAKCRACQDIRPYPKVLIVLRRLGRYPGAEVFTEEGVLVRFLEMPELSDEAKTLGLTEELLVLRLPKSWRHLMGLAARRIQSEVFRGVSLAETLRYMELLADIQTLRNFNNE